MNLFCRRGSNLSLLLDVSTLGVETMCSVTTPKEVWLQLLHTSSRPLTHAMLQDASRDTKTLNTEYQVTNSHNATLVNSAASSSEYEWLARWSNWLLWRRHVWYSACPLLLRRRSLQTLSAQQSWTSQDIWSKTDTKPSSPVSNLTVEFHLMSFFFFFSIATSHQFAVFHLDPESRVILKNLEDEAGPDRYINANYVRVRRGTSHCTNTGHLTFQMCVCVWRRFQ